MKPLIEQLEFALCAALEQLVYMERDLREIRAAMTYQRLVFSAVDPLPKRTGGFYGQPYELLLMAEEGYQIIYNKQLRLIATELATFTFANPQEEYQLTINVSIKSDAERVAVAQPRNFDYPHDPWIGPGEPPQAEMGTATHAPPDTEREALTTEETLALLKAAIRHGGVSVKELQQMVEDVDG